MPADSQFELLVRGPEPGQGWRRPLPAEGPVRLGRAPQQGWATPWEMRVSREQADLELTNEALKVRCLDQARNGGVVNGEAMREFSMRPGEEFRIGNTIFRFQRCSDADMAGEKSGSKNTDAQVAVLEKQLSEMADKLTQQSSNAARAELELKRVQEDAAAQQQEAQKQIELLTEQKNIAEANVVEFEESFASLNKEIDSIRAARASDAGAQTELAKLHEDLNAAKMELETANSETAAAKSELETAQSETAAAKSELETAQSEAATAKSDLETAKSELEMLQADYEKLHGEFAELRTAQADGNNKAVASAEQQVNKVRQEFLQLQKNATDMESQYKQRLAKLNGEMAPLREAAGQTQDLRNEVVRLKQQLLEVQSQPPTKTPAAASTPPPRKTETPDAEPSVVEATTPESSSGGRPPVKPNVEYSPTEVTPAPEIPSSDVLGPSESGVGLPVVMAGQMFGRFRLHDRLTVNGRSQLFRAERDGEIFSLQVIAPEVSRVLEPWPAFEEKVNLLKRLDHPNVLKVLECGMVDGVGYLLMEPVTGYDLVTLVNQFHPLPIPNVLGYLSHAAVGLDYIHGEGIYHRNVKPTNLIVDEAGVTRVLGLETAYLSGANIASAKRASVVGAANFMAPEQAINSESIDHRADIYGLGCTLFTTLTSQTVYKGRTAEEVVKAHRERPTPLLREIRDDVSAELEIAFSRMLAKRPDERFQSMDDVIASLQAVSE